MATYYVDVAASAFGGTGGDPVTVILTVSGTGVSTNSASPIILEAGDTVGFKYTSNSNISNIFAEAFASTHFTNTSTLTLTSSYQYKTVVTGVSSTITDAVDIRATGTLGGSTTRTVYYKGAVSLSQPVSNGATVADETTSGSVTVSFNLSNTGSGGVFQAMQRPTSYGPAVDDPNWGSAISVTDNSTGNVNFSQDRGTTMYYYSRRYDSATNTQAVGRTINQSPGSVGAVSERVPTTPIISSVTSASTTHTVNLSNNPASDGITTVYYYQSTSASAMSSETAWRDQGADTPPAGWQASSSFSATAGVTYYYWALGWTDTNPGVDGSTLSGVASNSFDSPDLVIDDIADILRPNGSTNHTITIGGATSTTTYEVRTTSSSGTVVATANASTPNGSLTVNDIPSSGNSTVYYVTGRRSVANGGNNDVSLILTYTVTHDIPSSSVGDGGTGTYGMQVFDANAKTVLDISDRVVIFSDHVTGTLTSSQLTTTETLSRAATCVIDMDPVTVPIIGGIAQRQDILHTSISGTTLTIARTSVYPGGDSSQPAESTTYNFLVVYDPEAP
jgi:hypothetical protein